MPRIPRPDKRDACGCPVGGVSNTMLGEEFRLDEGAHMAVRDALLSILMIGPAYGFQLHGELAARTGGRRVVNVGQTYGTLERLADRGLVESAGTTTDGLPLHRLTTAGRAAAEAWLQGADASVSDPWDETVDRVLVGASLPGVDVAAILTAERARWAERRDAARATIDTPVPQASDGVRTSVSVEADLLAKQAGAVDAARADALIAWLDALMDAPPPPFGLSTVRPRRGRRPAAQPASA